MKHYLHLFILSLLVLSCTDRRAGAPTDSTADSVTVAAPAAEAVDTLRGFIGDGTSMNVIELVNTEATDTAYLELGDDVERRATLEVGNEVKVIVRQEADGSQTVLATENAN